MLLDKMQDIFLYFYLFILNHVLVCLIMSFALLTKKQINNPIYYMYIYISALHCTVLYCTALNMLLIFFVFLPKIQ
ncbi:hypothetical protein F4703DRAFT_1851829 [Phycomyces blakesleeanus]